MNIDLNKYHKDSLTLINRIKDSSPEHLTDAYAQIEVRVGLREDAPLTSIVWKSWKLQLCSFIVTPGISPLDTQVDDEVYINADMDIVVRTHHDDASMDFKSMRKAYVYEIIDAFLEGDWTPPWKCGYCRDRIKGLVKPRW